jgi:hypothetical protein
MIHVFDDVLPDPEAYRAEALKHEFETFDFGHVVFHGIAPTDTDSLLCQWIKQRYSYLFPALTFFRKSPLGQVEPHLIHTDVDMGQWSGLLYLNPEPPQGDGTAFWIHSSGAIQSLVPHERSEEGKNSSSWALRELVQAKFNRLVLFPSSYFHSRAIPENWGEGDDARLTQVVFGTGVLP